MRDEGVGSWPRRRARMTPAKPALVQDGTRLSYARLDEAVTRLAHGLRARGVARGDRVAYLGLNSIEMVVTILATARLGAVSVPVNTRLATPELAYVLEHSGARAAPRRGRPVRADVCSGCRRRSRSTPSCSPAQPEPVSTRWPPMT